MTTQDTLFEFTQRLRTVRRELHSLCSDMKDFAASSANPIRMLPVALASGVVLSIITSADLAISALGMVDLSTNDEETKK